MASEEDVDWRLETRPSFLASIKFQMNKIKRFIGKEWWQSNHYIFEIIECNNCASIVASSNSHFSNYLFIKPMNRIEMKNERKLSSWIFDYWC